MTDVTMIGLAVAAGICSAALVLVYAKRQQRVLLKNRPVIEKMERENGDIDKELLDCLKQIELSFGAIVDAVNRERRIFSELIRKNENRTKAAPSHTRITGQRLGSTAGEGAVGDRTGDLTDKHMANRYNTITKFADSGLDPDEISRRVKMPRGEIELILKFKSLWQKSHASQ